MGYKMWSRGGGVGQEKVDRRPLTASLPRSFKFKFKVGAAAAAAATAAHWLWLQKLQLGAGGSESCSSSCRRNSHRSRTIPRF